MEYLLKIDRNARDAEWLLSKSDAEELPDVLQDALTNETQASVMLTTREAELVKGWIDSARTFGYSRHGVDMIERRTRAHLG